MPEIPLNKFEKVIELHLEGKTIRAIAPIVHMSFRDISKTIKAYEKKVRLQNKNETQEGNNQTTTKKLSKSSQAFILFRKGKQIDEVKVLLDIPFKLAIRYWKAYLKSIRLFEAFEFYQEYSYDMPIFLSIAGFFKRSNISGKDIANVLGTANDFITLNQTYSKLKAEIEKMEQIKHNYSFNQNIKYPQLPPLGLPRYYYEKLL